MKKSISTSDNINKVIKKTIDNDSIDLKKIFGSRFKYQTKENILFDNEVICKLIKDTLKSNITIKPVDCQSDINLFVNDKFKLLKANKWLEEALPHKDLYYSKDNYIVIFDMLNYCKTGISDTLFLESIRIFNTNNYFKEANNNGSIRYSLKK